MIRRAALTAALALFALGAADASAASFSGKPAVEEIEALCVTRGADRGVVFVAVAARYHDAPRARGFGRHEVRSSLRLRNAGGRLVATDTDRGRAQVDIPVVDSYVHTHLHPLSRAESRRVLGGRRCTARTAVRVRAQVRITQRLTGGAGASARPPSQVAGDAVETTVRPRDSAPRGINGCVENRLGLLDCAASELSNVSFVGREISFSVFWLANLTGADFTGVQMDHVAMDGARLSRAKLNGAQLEGASFIHSFLTETDFEGAVAPYANFAAAMLSDANLKGANLSGANLADAGFAGANACDAETIMPQVFGFACVNGAIAPR